MGIESFFTPGVAVAVIGFDQVPEEVCETLLSGQGLTPSYAFRGFVRALPRNASDAVLVGYAGEATAFGGTPVTPYSVALANALKDVGLLLRSQDDSGRPGPKTYVIVRVDRDRIDRVFDRKTFERDMMATVAAALRDARKPPN
jgi:hypothetical protein